MSATLPVRRAVELETQPKEERWLVEDLWLEQAVGIIGGEPKCCKSFLALDLAVSVAAGVPCLRTYAARRTGRVLLFAAEDALHVVRDRIAGICRAAGAEFSSLDLYVVTVPSVRLDLRVDREKLRATVADLQPRLLVLDPFVRLHRVDENASAFVAPLLAFLRELQREHRTAVAVVHHARKGAGRIRPGQALRGSSEFHSWGDSNLYLRRSTAETLILDVEHRAAPGVDGITLRLTEKQESLALEPTEPMSIPVDEEEETPEAQILAVLEEEEAPIRMKPLLKRCRGRTATLCKVLGDLVEDGRVIKTSAGYELPLE